MTKFTLNLTKEQEQLLDKLQAPLSVSTRADVLRKALAFALLYAEIREKKQNLLIADENGNPIERIRVV